MKVNCESHSKSMELLSLKVRLDRGISDPEERQEVSRRIEVLEKELKMD